ncbi:MAG: hypothetical protein IKV59_03095 [Lachnospiraceae bacterium]|nr:hypothetical protein [Lachnospiraceae bacterium]
MKKWIIKCATILLAFIAGMGFMHYTTYMGNRDMTAVMAEATLPVVYAERDGQMYNEMRGYVQEMDGSHMKESILGLSEEHELLIAIEKYNAHIEAVSYEVRSLDMDRLIQSGENLTAQDDGKYLHLNLDFQDLLDRGEKYLLILKVQTEEHEQIFYYSQITYLGSNYVQECVDFIMQFHQAALEKNHSLLGIYLEPDTTLMDGKNLGYVNIHSRTGPVSWGDMQVEKVSEPRIRFTGLDGDVVSLVMDYELRNKETEEIYEVSESFQVRYAKTRMYMNAYERTANKIFEVGDQLVEDGKIAFGIQGSNLHYKKNEEETVVGFVQQGQLWCYDFSQNRLSHVYGFQDEKDDRGDYDAHDFRILQVEDSGSTDFLVYGYMNRGQYEGMSGILLCHYDALMNTVEEQYFLPSDRPYQVVKEELGKLASTNGEGKAWLSYRGMILQINLTDCTVQVLEENVSEDHLQMSQSGRLTAWTDADAKNISLLNMRNGIVNQITTKSGEALRVLGFMEEDFIYGAAKREDMGIDQAGREIMPMYRVIIRDHSGNAVREFDYGSKGKYVTGVSIVENRIDLSCVQLTAGGNYVDERPEPITYTSEPVDEHLRLTVVSDDVKRNEYHFVYQGTMRNGSMKQPKVKLVLFENNRTLQLEHEGRENWYAWSYDGAARGYEGLSEAIQNAHEGMGKVWKNGWKCCWERTNRVTRKQISGFDDLDALDLQGSSLAQCIQLLLRQKQIYVNVQEKLDAGEAVWEILQQELGDSSCVIPGCSLDMVKYFVSKGIPVMGMTDTGKAVLIVGYDTMNIIYYEPGQTVLQKMGNKDSSTMFAQAGNLFYTYLP